MRIKQITIAVFSLLVLLSCSNDEGNRNPFLQEIGFRIELNTNLPLYSPLTSPGNPVFVDSQGAGIRGIFVINTGFDLFRAFEASCPNQSPSPCSTMEIVGQNAVCDCDDLEYNLFTGQLLNRPDDGERYFDMLEYRAVQNGSVVVVSN